jgi:hypothetical protein
MPKPEQLPESLRDFAFINAAPIDTGRDFHRDLNRVLATIDTITGQPSTKIDGQEVTDDGASSLLPIQGIAAIEPQASDENTSRSDQNVGVSQVAAVGLDGQRRSRARAPAVAVAVGGFLVLGAALWFLPMRSEPGKTVPVAPPAGATETANRETPVPAPQALVPQPASTPVGPATTISSADSDPGAKVVRDFYAALSRGDGAAAAELVVPERRNGNYDPKAMTDFFSKNYQRLQLTEVATAGQNTYHVTYTFKKSERSSDCPFSGTVSVTQRSGQYLIQNTNVRPGC